MMGMIYTELVDMMEERFSLDLVDRVLARARLAGAWTAGGAYADEELFALVGALSEETGIAVGDLLHEYGTHLFGTFVRGHGRFFEGHSDAFSFLRVLETTVHAEVRRLWPVAVPPLFTPADLPDGTFTLRYQSERGMARLAKSLLESSIAHFGPRLEILEEDRSGGAGKDVLFHLVPTGTA
jgi:hypothetical protein